MKQEFKLSPALRLKAEETYNIIKEKGSVNTQYLADKLNLPIVMLPLIITPLNKANLVEFSCLATINKTDKIVLPAIVPALIRQGETRTDSKLYEEFIMAATKVKFNAPSSLYKTEFKELTINEYLNKKEFYDLASANIFYSNKTQNPFFLNQYFYRQLKRQLVNTMPDLKSFIYVAENDGQVLGFVCFSNYNACDNLSHNLPCENKEIYNVSFIATRKDVQGKGIASTLLEKATESLLEKEDVFALNYLPINKTSEHIMKKVFAKPTFFVTENISIGEPNKIKLCNHTQFTIFPVNERTTPVINSIELENM